MKLKREETLGLVRHILTFGGGLAVGAGLMDEATVQSIVGALVTLVGAAWSVRQKRQ